MELGHIVFSCTKWFTQLARKYKVSWNPWASFAWRRGCWWRIFANFSSEGWRCEWSSPVFFLAAHKQGYRITTLHMGNGWATCNPVYVQLFFAGWWLCYFVRFFSLWALNHAMFFWRNSGFLDSVSWLFLWTRGFAPSKTWLPLIKSVGKKLCCVVNQKQMFFFSQWLCSSLRWWNLVLNFFHEFNPSFESYVDIRVGRHWHCTNVVGNLLLQTKNLSPLWSGPNLAKWHLTWS